MIRLVLSDLDNTLIAHRPGEAFGEATISDLGLDAVRALLDCGGHFGPVTGRDQSSLADTFRGASWAYATGAFSNGQLVCVDGDVVHREWTAAEPLQRVSDILDEREGALLVFFDVEGDGPVWGVSRTHAVDAGPQRSFLRVERIVPEVEGPTLKAIIRLFDGDGAVELRDLLRREVEELDFMLPSPDARVIDIVPKGYGKGSAVKIMAKALGIGLDEVAAFGDADNDVSMLDAAVHSVAVANASPQASAAARYHIADALDDSVARAIADIARATERGALPDFMRS
jgi:hydroxymethylpyrimidine pyrophosphatase-like HAD family hydrolase